MFPSPLDPTRQRCTNSGSAIEPGAKLERGMFVSTTCSTSMCIEGLQTMLCIRNMIAVKLYEQN